MKLKPKVLVLAVMGTAAAAALTGCAGSTGSGGASGSSYTLGFNDALSGPIAFAGASNLAGFQTYIDQVNSTGGVNGHQVELKVLDDRSDAGVAIANFKQLASGGALGVFGNSASSAMVATAPLAASLKVPEMGLANADDFYQTYHPWVFKNSITAAQQVALQGELVTNTLYKGKSTAGLKVAIMQTSTASGPPYTASVKQLAAQKGWTVTTAQQAALGATDCATQAGLIVSSGTQVVFGNITSVGEDVVCMNALLARGFNGQFIDQNSSAAEKTFATLHSPQWISLRVVNQWADPSVPGAKALQAQAKQFGLTSKLGDYSADGYVAATLAVHALKTCGDHCTGTTLRDELEKLKNVDTGGIAGPETGFTTGNRGHTFPQAGFFVWDAAKGRTVALGGWLDSGR